MAQQIINIGANPLDGSGDPLRVGGQKINANFSEIYTSIPGVINVKSGYGAKGDGVTDDTAAIQVALNSVSATGGTVYIPPGNFKVGPLHIPSTGFGGTHIVGAGVYSTQLTFTPTGNALPSPIPGTVDPGTCIQALVATGVSFTVNAGASTTTMTITGVLTGAVVVGATLAFAGQIGRVTIASFGTFNGTSGTVVLSSSQTWSAQTVWAVSQILYNCSVENLFIYSTDTSFSKIALRLVECSQFELRRLLIQGFYGGDSVGIQSMGHELQYGDTVHVEACVPLRMSKALIPFSGIYYDSDHFSWNNVYLIAGLGTGAATSAKTQAAKYYPTTLPSACVLVDDGVLATHLSWDGAQAWVGGQYGLYWVSTASPVSAIYNISFKNIRTEQGWGTPTNNFYIDFSGGSIWLFNLSFENCFASNQGTGWYLRNINQITIKDSSSNSGGGSAYVVDGNIVYNMQWVGMRIASISQLNNLVNCGFAINAVFQGANLLPFAATWAYSVLGPHLSVTAAAGATNNLQPGDARWPQQPFNLSITTTAGVCNWTGLLPGNDGQLVRLDNLSGGSILTLNNLNGGSSTANQFKCPGNADFALATGHSAQIQYDGGVSKWIVIG